MYKHFRGLKLSFFASFSVQFLLSTWTMKHCSTLKTLQTPYKIIASNEAGLAQEIREISFEHLLLYTISVAYGHWASTTSATALGVHSPASLLSSPSPPSGVLRLDVLPPFLKSEREVGLLLTPPSASIACLLQGIFHPIYTSNTPMCPVQLCNAVL